MSGLMLQPTGPDAMLRLYDYLPSQNGWKARQILAHLDLPYEQRLVEIFQGEQHRPEFQALNPGGTVPVLEVAPRRAIAESNAILCYLAEGTTYLPADRFERAKVMQWLFFEQNYVEPVIGSLRYWTLTGKLERNAAGVPARRQRGQRSLEALDRHLATHEFLAGRYSIADIALYAYGAWAEEGGFDLAPFPAFRAWAARVAGQPGHLATRYPYSIDPHASRDL
jgi:glutathione S-transferase